MSNRPNRGKSSHAAKHFCSIEQAAAMGEEAVKMARAERIAATAELVKAFEGRIAGLESRIEALESSRWSARIRRAWRWLTRWVPPTPEVARPHDGPLLEEGRANG